MADPPGQSPLSGETPHQEYIRAPEGLAAHHHELCRCAHTLMFASCLASTALVRIHESGPLQI